MARLISKEDVFLFKTVTEREDDEETIKDNQYRPENFRKSDFGAFLRVQKNLSDETVKKHVSLVGVFLSHYNGCIDARSVHT
ncbi:MAG: hypothetical protein KJ714_07490 [Euryarchaeota archaeon]|nr:hypothetical protein [Euryarchaeota archaeon]